MSQQGLNSSGGDNGGIQIDPSSNLSSPRSASISRTQSSSSSSFVASHLNCFRSLSCVDSIEFKFDGNISKYGLTLGDCDNDEKNELVIGTLNGKLLIYKNDCQNPQASTKDLGMVACVLVGDILNLGWNYIISLSIEGYLKIFHLYNDSQVDLINQSNETVNSIRRHKKFSNSMSMSNVKLPPTISDNEVYSSTTKLILVHAQQIQANAMCALLVDFDNDGNQEFFVALSDRVVRCYRSIYYGEEIKLIGLYKWEFSDQIGSITLHDSSNYNVIGPTADNDESLNYNKKSILVTQFGGVFAKITSCCNAENDDLKSEEIERTVEYCHTIVPYMRNPQTSAEILSDIRSNDPNEKLIAIAAHDGTLILLSNDQQTIKWCLQLEHPILSLNKHDLNEDGCDELIISVWNGLVYIIDLDGNIITCHFHEPISAFIVGRFHLNDQFDQVNCFVYTTFTNSIHLYYNIDTTLFNIDTGSNYLLRNIEKKKPEILKSLEKLVRLLNIDQDSKEAKIVPDLIRTLLYEVPGE